jgi:hypothetical protein
MKKNLVFKSICVLTSLLFASCTTHFSITKRHYNKGYSIHHSNSGNVSASHSSEEKNSVVEADPEVLDKAVVIESSNVPVKVEYGSVNTGLSTVQTTEKSVKTTGNPVKGQHIAHVQKKNVANPVFAHTGYLKKHSLKGKMGNNAASHEDGLSLFWVVILVILILWAIGFLAAGLTGLINLLLLIALILLILWLLRVL